MKYLLVIFAIFFSSGVYAQTVSDNIMHNNNMQQDYEYYMQKSLNKKKTAKTLFNVGGGVTIAGGALVLIGAAGGFNPGEWLSGLGEVVMGAMVGGVGVLTMASSVPFKISSNKWQRRALEVKPVVGFQNIHLPNQQNSQPKVGLVINL